VGDSCCGRSPDAALLEARQRRMPATVMFVNLGSCRMMLVASPYSGSSSLLSGTLDNPGDARPTGQPAGDRRQQAREGACRPVRGHVDLHCDDRRGRAGRVAPAQHRGAGLRGDGLRRSGEPRLERSLPVAADGVSPWRHQHGLGPGVFAQRHRWGQCTKVLRRSGWTRCTVAAHSFVQGSGMKSGRAHSWESAVDVGAMPCRHALRGDPGVGNAAAVLDRSPKTQRVRHL
jgi:hypothetical protein